MRRSGGPARSATCLQDVGTRRRSRSAIPGHFLVKRVTSAEIIRSKYSLSFLAYSLKGRQLDWGNRRWDLVSLCRAMSSSGLSTQPP
jgi:hypothetical protein